MRYYVTFEGTEHPVDIELRPSGGHDVVFAGKSVVADVVSLGATLSMILDGHVIDLTVEGLPPKVGVVASGRRVYLEVESARARAAHAAKSRSASKGDDVVSSPMPGRILNVLVSEGDDVSVGQALVVVEAMKMENELRATRAGKVAAVLVAAGANVEAGTLLVKIA